MRPDDHEVVVVPSVDGGVQFLHLLLGGNDALSLEVAALLRPLLVLEDDAGDARADALAHRADDVERVAVAGVHIGHERHVDGGDDRAHAIEHLGGREQAVVGGAEGGGGEAESGREDGIEAGLLSEPRGKGVVGAGQHDDLGPVEPGPQGGRVAHLVLHPAPARWPGRARRIADPARAGVGGARKGRDRCDGHRRSCYSPLPGGGFSHAHCRGKIWGYL